MPKQGATTVAEPRADDARVAPHLTHELLEWGTAALEAILSTPEVNELRVERPKSAISTALKQLDHLWPYAKETHAGTQDEGRL